MAIEVAGPFQIGRVADSIDWSMPQRKDKANIHGLGQEEPLSEWASGGSPDDGARVIQYLPHGGANQQWILRPVSSDQVQPLRL